MSSSDGSLAYPVLRLTLGVNILLHGLTRIQSGVGTFADSMVGMFASTPLPAVLVRLFGMSLPWVESVVGGLIAAGLFTRQALAAGGLLMAALVFGTALRSDWGTLGNQMIYALIFYVALANVGSNRYALDGLAARWRQRNDSIEGRY